MSLTAFKRKSAALYGPHSSRGGVALAGGFSLNGKLRFRGVGETNLIATDVRTPFKGTDPIGFGGGTRCRVRGIRGRATKCNSHDDYPKAIIYSKCCIPQTLVKTSTMNTSGMLETRFQGLFHGTYPNTWVKPARADRVWEKAHQPFLPECKRLDDGSKSIQTTRGCGPYSKPMDVPDYVQHQRKITAQCVIPSCTQRPFPFWASNRNACGLTLTTWQQAKAHGSLCEDFSG